MMRLCVRALAGVGMMPACVCASMSAPMCVSLPSLGAMRLCDSEWLPLVSLEPWTT